MWCPKCQADVAAEVMADNRSVRCATCGGEVNLSSTTRTSVKTREARELLERWANDHLLTRHEPIPDPHEDFLNHNFSPSASPMSTPSAATRRAMHSGDYAASDQAPPASHATDAPRSSGSSAGPKTRKFRIDQAHPTHESASQRQESPAPSNQPASNAERRISAVREREQSTVQRTPATRPAQPIPAPHASFDRSAQRSATRRVDRAHAAMAAPHFDIQSAIREQERPRTNWTSLTGQLLAYLGVAGLTVGSSLVLWSYFGGPVNYAPTGWLVTTAGQMLLFLGVVTLVSGGMEQTTEEVKFRIERLGDKLLRYEQSTRDHALRGPHTSAGHYEDGYDEEDDVAEYAPSQRDRSRR